MTKRRVTIGITLGDPKGIGPEIVAKALAEAQVREACEIRVFGDETILAKAQELCRSTREHGFQPATSACPPEPWRRRNQRLATLSDVEAGHWSAQWVANAVKAALDGEIDAIVTGPINKARWHAAGIQFPGHTEYLAYLAGQTTTGIGPLFVAPRWKVALATGHVSLKNVGATLTRERVIGVATLLHETLRTLFGIAEPRLACLGLNPHAGEAGLLGLEELEVIEPALLHLQERGIRIEGPFPADTFFVPATSDQRLATPFDAVLAMYHDQGLIPLKTVAFAETVQMTMGLPFLRTSVDHGTAEDIAWQGIADHRNLVEAITMATVILSRQAKEPVSNTGSFTYGSG